MCVCICVSADLRQVLWRVRWLMRQCHSPSTVSMSSSVHQVSIHFISFHIVNIYQPVSCRRAELKIYMQYSLPPISQTNSRNILSRTHKNLRLINHCSLGSQHIPRHYHAWPGNHLHSAPGFNLDLCNVQYETFSQVLISEVHNV